MASTSKALPPPPPIPANLDSTKAGKEESQPKILPMDRRGFGTKGYRIQLQSNHFSVDGGIKDSFFYHYSVEMSYEDGHLVEAKGIGRKVIDKVWETYDELKRTNFAYDGEKSLFTLGSLPANNMTLTVVVENLSSRRVGRPDDGHDSPTQGDEKRMRRESQSKTIKVEISYAARIPIRAIEEGLRGQDSNDFQEALRVLDIILRQHAAKQGCLLVRQSFFHDHPGNYNDLGGGVQGLRGFHSSFRPTQGGLSLNIDVSTTMVVKPGPVLDFLCENQNVKHPNLIDWTKAKSVLKNLRIKVNNLEFKISGLSDNTCRTQKFSWKRGKDVNGEPETIETTVFDYFTNHKGIELPDSADFPCINVGKPKRPTYFPVERCTLISLQRYTKALTNLQRTQLVEKSRQKPSEKKQALADCLRNSRYDNEPMLHSAGINIVSDFTRVEGRVLHPPELVVGNRERFIPSNGRWNFNYKRLIEPMRIERWAIVNFSSGCDLDFLGRTMTKCAGEKGININSPIAVFEEVAGSENLEALLRVKKMYRRVQSWAGWNRNPPRFLLCILPERKNSELYGPWKRINATEGIATQCIAPKHINNQYATNVLLKINAKLGGMNSLLSMERDPIPLLGNKVTLILGMDVSHGSPGRSDMPSIAAVVSSRTWPSMSRYKAVVRTQPPRVEMIQDLFQPVPSLGENTKDEGIIRELLMDFYNSSNKRKPDQIIIFRDGVSESQFVNVLNEELATIIEACKYLEESWSPKFTFIVAQKNHHTRFFMDASDNNVPPGTVIDSQICHPRKNDFYMCAHYGMIGTTRPTHYHVLHDEIGFHVDALQELVHSLCYVCQRTTNATSIVAPICYAHLAATQMAQTLYHDPDEDEASSSHGGATSSGAVRVPKLPVLDHEVADTMFFC